MLPVGGASYGLCVNPRYPFWLRRVLPAGALLLAACGGDPAPTAPEGPAGPAVAVQMVGHQDLACTDPCGMKLTYEARTVDTGEPAAATLHLSGDGWFPQRVQTSLPEGRTTFFWEYPRPRLSGTTYRLVLCPESGACASASATVYLPE
jgi:hypothetical protein